MNCSSKLKIRQQVSSREDPSIRRIRTDYLDATKKQSKQPLADSKKMANNNISANTAKPSKKITVVKSTVGKTTNNYSRLTT